METFGLASLAPLRLPRPAVSVGNFDGVHRGHQALAAAIVAEAKRTGGTSVVVTFDPHPSRVLSPERAPATLMSIAQRAETLAAIGVERLAVLPFTRELAAVPPAAFARDVLAGALQASVVVVGEGFRFGRGRSGDLAKLVGFGDALGFRVVGLPPVLHEGAPISSTRVREALARGAVEAATQLLGRPYFVEGPVVRGVGRGRTLGIPTANVDPVNETLPAGGVYACWARVVDELLAAPAVVNIGRRPTFGGGAVVLEAHILDTDRELYGRVLRLAFVARLREERRFDAAPALLEQIGADLAAARRLLEPAPWNAV